MGCFASACCVSGLPVEAGDPVRWLLLVENLDATGSFISQPHGRWVPRTWPLRAVYNDYGSIEEWDEDLADLVLQGLSEDVLEREQGPNPHHDVAVRRGMTFQEVLVAVWEGCVRVREHPDMAAIRQQFGEVTRCVPGRLVQQGMIREDVWQALLGLEFRTWRGVDTLSDYREGVRAWFEGGLVEEPGRGVHRLGSQTLSRSTEGAGPHGLRRHAQIGLEVGLDLESLVTEFSYIYDVLHTLRYVWRPSDTTGPQIGDWDLHAAYLQALSTAVSKAVERRES